MRVGFQHLAPYAGHESTLLRFEHDGQTDCVLVDSGDGVDLDCALDDDEYLAAALVTHAHIDHYRTLGRNLRHQAPVYASPGAAAALERALAEAEKDNDVGDVDAVVDALVPIEEWTRLVDGLDVAVRPVPAGHAPRAAGFLVRVEDDPLDAPEYVLVTGDFTRRPCAGNPGLPLDLPRPLRAAFVNASTTEGFEGSLTDAVEATLERAFAGGRVVVGTSGLGGVHFAYVLGHAASVLGESLPVRVVGQAAKLYEALGYDAPHVTATPVFERTGDVLVDGGVTVAGPEAPSNGSSGRLFEAVRDDPAALFAQVTASDATAPASAACATKRFELVNHPTRETLDGVIEELSPENVVVKHASNVEQYRNCYPDCFVWASKSTERYGLYEDGEWLRPEWMNEHGIRRIEMSRYGSAGATAPVGGGDGAWSVSLARTGRDLDAEGLDVSRLRDAFSLDAASAGARGYSRAESTADGGSPPEPQGGETGDAGSESTVDLSAVVARLDAIEARLDANTVRARVLDGSDVTLLEVLDDVDIDDGDVVSVVVDADDE